MPRFMMFFGLALAQIAAGCADPPDSPLGHAAAKDDATEVQRLIAAGHGVNDVGPSGGTPLLAAVRHGALKALRALLDAGADPDLPDSRGTGWSPVKHAIHTRHPEALRVLLERGADPNGAGRGGGIPLLMAAAEEDPIYVTLLLAHGADPRGDRNQGANVLSKAVSGGALEDIDRPLLGGCHPQTVRALLEHDPTLRLSPDYGPSRGARWIARFHGCREVLRLVELADQRAMAKEGQGR
jgi:ankyrin repeat protein